MFDVYTRDYLTKQENKVPLSFYEQETFTVTRSLLGKILVSNVEDKLVAGRIVEVEPYIGAWDKASHAYPNKITPRTKIQFDKGGVLYIYFVYGMHYQLCVVAEQEGVASAILIRAVEPVFGLDAIRRRRGEKVKDIDLTNGPGKLCKAFGITKDLNGQSLIGDKVWIVKGEDVPDESVLCSPRVGIDYAQEFAKKPWRMYIKDNAYVSKIKTKGISYKKAQKTFTPD